MDKEVRLARKLKRNPAAILTDREVKLMVELAARVWRDSFPGLDGHSPHESFSLRFDDSFRWRSLGVKCRRARETLQLDLKGASTGAKLPRYRIKAIESGYFGEFSSDLAWQYFEFLGIRTWVRRWCKSNAELAERVGINPFHSQVSAKRRSHWRKSIHGVGSRYQP